MTKSADFDKAMSKDIDKANEHGSHLAADFGGFVASAWSADVNANLRDLSKMGEVLSHISRAEDSMVNAAMQFAGRKANDLYNENKDVMKATGESVLAVGHKIDDHRANRPTTAAVESLLPPLLVVDALTRKDHKADAVPSSGPELKHNPNDKAQNLPYKGPELGKHQPADAIHNLPYQGPELGKHQPADAIKPLSADNSHHHTVKAGESFWSIAKEQLNDGHHKASNTEIAERSAALIARNKGHETLLPNLEIVA